MNAIYSIPNSHKSCWLVYRKLPLFWITGLHIPRGSPCDTARWSAHVCCTGHCSQLLRGSWYFRVALWGWPTTRWSPVGSSLGLTVQWGPGGHFWGWYHPIIKWSSTGFPVSVRNLGQWEGWQVLSGLVMVLNLAGNFADALTLQLEHKRELCWLPLAAGWDLNYWLRLA